MYRKHFVMASVFKISVQYEITKLSSFAKVKVLFMV